MAAKLQQMWSRMRGQGRRPASGPGAPAGAEMAAAPRSSVDIAPDDPLLEYLLSAPNVVEIDKAPLQSPAVEQLRAAGVKLIVPLVSQGELVGVLNLGPRRSDQEYSADDRALLNSLAAQAAPAVRVAQLVREHQAEALARERLEQELRVARQIQLSLLPKEAPRLEGWQIAPYYQPARAVGGDFYDFLELPDGQLMIVAGDVTDKGVPAALVMATTRSVLRGAARRIGSPAEVLERANDLLCPEMPPHMFVTCFYAVLDPASGRLRFANAGHNLPYRRHADGVTELYATGMPLGLMPGIRYEEAETTIQPGDSVLLYSDGLVEAHDPAGAMFGVPRLAELVGAGPGGGALIDSLVAELGGFTGPAWEQEDDITLVVLERAAAPVPRPEAPVPPGMSTEQWATVAHFAIPSTPGNERLAMQQVVDALGPLALPTPLIERIKTAVAEATMNAMEHGNQHRPDLPVSVTARASPSRLLISITDQGGATPIPEAVTPDLDAKLAGLQTTRGWGLFLIRNMVDDLRVLADSTRHTVELIFVLEGAPHAGSRN
jgi:serine phosphatase RsbU (regulator of sigma subunit)/anti-sigma regulatory factor (Ser/Thr protein kinase)